MSEHVLGVGEVRSSRVGAVEVVTQTLDEKRRESTPIEIL